MHTVVRPPEWTVAMVVAELFLVWIPLQRVLKTLPTKTWSDHKTRVTE